jgi:hypothetical protein
VRLGALRLGLMSPHALLAPVWRVMLPLDYAEDKAQGDLALLQLRRPVPLSARVQPVCLPAPGFYASPGSQCWVTGWGSLRPGGKAWRHCGSPLVYLCGNPNPYSLNPRPRATFKGPVRLRESQPGNLDSGSLRMPWPLPLHLASCLALRSLSSSSSATPKVATLAGSKGATAGLTRL